MGSHPQSESIKSAEAALGVTFSDSSVLEQALVHSSVSDSRLDSNERMEFLGDAVLGVITCELIYLAYPDMLEGEMTKIKSTVVSRRTCAKIANQLGLDDLLVLGKGMQTSGARPPSLGAAALEAVIAAVYIDQGFEACRRMLTPLLEPFIERAHESGHQHNFKSVLQQFAQQGEQPPPSYRVLDEQGPDHAKCFKVEVEVGEQRFAGGWAPSKKQAEQVAALEALLTLGIAERSSEGLVTVARDDEGHPTSAAG
ncbi:MAG: ribonuclease III [Planctomycetota bacterium]